MMSLFARKAVSKAPTTAVIDGTAVAVAPGETVLQAALRAGIDFPHDCRVGSCTTCRCRLVEGQVQALTRASYVLTAEQLAEGFILACQSVPRTDVRIEVRAAGAAVARVSGRVTGHTRLTPDIVEVRGRLEAALPYRAGQFADIAIATVPGVRRSYSFATPARPDGEVRFFVRRQAGGAFSAPVYDTDVTGAAITVDGPRGGFGLRPAAAPLLFVAGGSGLAPILAMLEEAAHAGVTRPATLLFGVRSQHDLYALERIAAVAGGWAAPFAFIPVLSEEAGDSGWRGERGPVTAVIPRALEPGAHAYLCGPPAMIDGAIGVLSQHGVAPGDIHADRFVASGGAAAAPL